MQPSLFGRHFFAALCFASSTRSEGCDDPAIEAKRGAYASPAAGSACSFPMRKVSMCGRGVVFAHRLKLDLGVVIQTKPARIAPSNASWWLVGGGSTGSNSDDA